MRGICSQRNKGAAPIRIPLLQIFTQSEAQSQTQLQQHACMRLVRALQQDSTGSQREEWGELPSPEEYMLSLLFRLEHELQ